MSEIGASYDAATMFRLGWLPEDYVYFRNGGTFTLNAQSNTDASNKDLTGLVYLCPYTGAKVFMSYNTWLNPKTKSLSFWGVVFVITMPNTAGRYQVLESCDQKECSTPHGWKISILEHSETVVKVRTDYLPQTVQYSPSEIDIKMQRTGKKRTAAIVTIRDATLYDQKHRRDAWPRLFSRGNIKMISQSTGDVFDCVDPPSEWKVPKGKYDFGDLFIRHDSNKLVCEFELESSRAEDIFVLTTSIITHSQTKKVKVAFDI